MILSNENTLSTSGDTTVVRDILAELAEETARKEDFNAETTFSNEKDIVQEVVNSDILVTDPFGQMVQEAEQKVQKNRQSLGKSFGKHVKFLAHYIAVSTTVFLILLVATNFSAYWTVVQSVINPNAAKASGGEILSSMERSKMNVFANDSSEKLEVTKQSVDTIKAQLDAEGEKIQEEPFSMKHLLPSEPNVQVNFDIMPYENRIIIPKIGKNIPLVDVASVQGFDFDHMENIFMQELEKGVVRYPGSALPGENGNSFIFGHSSNYPWVKGGYNSVFALLDDLDFGDEIIVYYNQKKFVYKVSEKKIVKPGDVKSLERPEDKAELSLMTCWPIGTTLKRMLVFAELQSSN